MKMKNGEWEMTRSIILCLCLSILLSGCAIRRENSARTVRVVLEEGPGYVADERVLDGPVGSTFQLRVAALPGWEIEDCDYPGATCATGADGAVEITLNNVRYSTVVTLNVEAHPYRIRYHDGDSTEEVTYPDHHLRVNTAVRPDVDELISGDGSRLLCGWNTQPDGCGDHIGLGSRADVSRSVPLDLYADWRPFDTEGSYDWEADAAGRAVVTGYRGSAAEIVIPAYLDGRPVVGIAAGAFAGIECESVVLPPTLEVVKPHAFDGCALATLTFYDTIREITDYAFSDCANFKEILINAVRSPVYSGTYFDTFPDKLDRLRALEGRPKIILFSGSSARFGYDSEMIDAAFADYDVVNMGVFAYTSALPQFDLILKYTRPGDILIHSPEFDAIQRQFCTTDAMDEHFFAMIESNYDLLRLLDRRDYGGTLSAFTTFQKNRLGMAAGSYQLSASQFDEDHSPVSIPSYNAYGDYVVCRPNASDDAPIYNLPVDYLAEAFPLETVVEPLNRVYRHFQDAGARVFFTYAPRNRLALSDRSTEPERARLDQWLRQSLAAPVISDIEESLYPGHLLYGTDNHLSTEGVSLRTARLIRDIQEALGKEGTP